MKAVSVALFAGVVGGAFLQPASAADAAKWKETVLWSFGNGTDGADPQDDLINVNGTLYGTTAYGGAHGVGTLFSIDPNTAAEKVLYSFGSSNTDGVYPFAGLLNVNGTLYGTTNGGGPTGGGTVFAFDPSTGTETVVYSFCAKPRCLDGADLFSGVIDVNGTLYGATAGGGDNDSGTVFALNPNTGAETVLRSLEKRLGRVPEARLLDVKGELYGTTTESGEACLHRFCGTVFAVDPKTGGAKTVYAFCSQANCNDGEQPQAGVIDVKDTLYGTTFAGGSGAGGTVFALNPHTNAETVVHSFGVLVDDGRSVLGDLIDLKGTLYGTTQEGGTGDHYSAGTVFSVDTKSGAETVLYSFCSQSNCVDGAYPAAGVIDVNGTLYGTTEEGGVYGGAYAGGTVFALTKAR